MLSTVLIEVDIGCNREAVAEADTGFGEQQLKPSERYCVRLLVHQSRRLHWTHTNVVKEARLASD